jgi:hypothetical protein
LFESGLDGSAVVDRTVHGQIVTLNDSDWDPPYSEPVMAVVNCPLSVAVAAITVKVAFDEDAGTVTEEGAVREELELATVTSTPPAGAGPLSVTVHVLAAPAFKAVGLHDSVDKSTGLRFKVEVAVEVSEPLVFKLAVMATLWCCVTTPDVALKETELVSATTVTEVGTVSRVLVTVKFTI